MKSCFQASLFQAPVSIVVNEFEVHPRPNVDVLDYEVDDLSLESFQPSSPRSQELQDFENYSRRTLPILVEANLRAIVESEIAPIEERVRAMVVDIVRTCQSTVARNFRSTVTPASTADDQMLSSSQMVSSTEITMPRQPESARPSIENPAAASLDFFREPPHLNMEAGTSFPNMTYDYSSVTLGQNSNSDSGYSSLPNSCSCSCHNYFNSWNTAQGERSLSCMYDLQLTR